MGAALWAGQGVGAHSHPVEAEVLAKHSGSRPGLGWPIKVKQKRVSCRVDPVRSEVIMLQCGGTFLKSQHSRVGSGQARLYSETRDPVRQDIAYNASTQKTGAGGSP